MKDLELLMFTVFFTASLLWVNSVTNTTTYHENHRRRLGSWKDLETGYIPQYHLVPFTSRPNLPFIMKQLLLNRTELAWNISDSNTTSVKMSVQDFLNKYGSNSAVKERLHEGLNMKMNEKATRKGLHSLSTTDETLEDLVDIVIPITTPKDATLLFLESWKTTIKDLHVILIYAENIAFDSVSLPTWLNCIVYTKKEIVDFLGADSSLFSDYNSPTIRSFGYLISDRRFIYTIDPSSTPIISRDGMNVIETHVHNLMTPSTPLYFNTVYDPFVLGSDFTKGTPYSLRGGQPTGISHGLALGTEAFDSLTNVAKGGIGTSGVSVAHDVTVSIPFGTLYSQSFLNLAFNRETLGVVMFPPVLDKDDPLAGISDIINGWISKVIADIMGLGTKSGSPTINRTSSLLDRDYTDRLGGEFQSYFIQEEIINFFATIKLPINKDSSELMQEVAKLLERDLSRVSAYFTRTASRMRDWQKRWDNHHAFMNTRVPVAAYSSILSHRNATCAVLTITHNEKVMLPLWIRYYGRHVESMKDLYILDHNTNDGSTDNVPEGVVLLKLHGDQAGFPLAFMNRKAEELEYRLLRAGYRCVLFSDTDEMIAPDPRAYPGGLGEYFKKFLADSSLMHRRCNGVELAHVSYGNGSYSFEHVKEARSLTAENLQTIWSKYGYIEPPMNWSRSILSQRRYWIAAARYSKPLLTKIPIRYRPGFHNNFIGPMVMLDANLFLIHLKSSDLEFCKAHERAKYETAKRMHQDERAAGFNDHIVKFEALLASGGVCTYSVGCFIGHWNGNKTAVYDNTGRIHLDRMDDSWASVEM